MSDNKDQSGQTETDAPVTAAAPTDATAETQPEPQPESAPQRPILRGSEYRGIPHSNVPEEQPEKSDSEQSAPLSTDTGAEGVAAGTPAATPHPDQAGAAPRDYPTERLEKTERLSFDQTQLAASQLRDEARGDAVAGGETGQRFAPAQQLQDGPIYDDSADWTFRRSRRGTLSDQISTAPRGDQRPPGFDYAPQAARQFEAGQSGPQAQTGQAGPSGNFNPYQQSYSQQPYQPQPGLSPVPGQPWQPSPRKSRRGGPGWGALVTACVLTSALTVGGLYALSDVVEEYEFLSSTSTQPTSGTAPTIAPSQRQQGQTNWEKVADNVRQAVVAIQVDTGAGADEGSGVIFDQKGHVLTNHHVIADALNGGKIILSLADGRLFRAKVVGSDPTTDLAVLRIIDPPKDMVMAQLGDSAQLKVGQPVAAIGNPLGLSSTMTTGIISALDRPVLVRQKTPLPMQQGQPVITNAIQVDASINPGNSGGPLFDAAGTVIGINSSIASMRSETGTAAGSIGLGFAIPVDLAKMVAKQLIDNGSVSHAFLGVSLAPASGQAENQIRSGAEVRLVVPGSAAEKAGLKVGDLIIGIDGHTVGSGQSLTGFIRRYPVGAKVKLQLIRNGNTKTIEAILGQAPADNVN